MECWVDVRTTVKVYSPCPRLYIAAADAINNRPLCDSNLGRLTPQSDALTTVRVTSNETLSVGGEVRRLHGVQLVDGVAGGGGWRRRAGARRLGGGGDEETQRRVEAAVVPGRRAAGTAELRLVGVGHEVVQTGSVGVRRLGRLSTARCSTPDTGP